MNATPDNDGCKTYDQGQGNGRQTRIECQTSAACGGGQICCGVRVQNNNSPTYYSDVTCQAACTWPNLQLCQPNNPNAPCPTITTPQGTVQLKCQQSGLLPDGYWVCGTP